LLGYLLNWGLFGVLSCQVYLYHLAFPKDRTAAKMLVYGIYLLETTQTVLVTHDAFNGYAKGFGNLTDLNSAQLEWLAVPIFSGIVSCSVQMYYGYRLSLLSGSRIVPTLIAAIALMQGTSAIVQGVQAFFIGDFSDLETKAFKSCIVWLAGSAACDILIAISMTIVVSPFLVHLTSSSSHPMAQLLRKDTQVIQTQAIISRIIRLVVETGCLTAVSATIDLTLFLSFPHNAYHGTVALTLAKLYSNSLLVIFNSRLRIVDGRSEVSESKVTFNWRKSSVRSPTVKTHSVSLGSTTMQSIGEMPHIQKESETWGDAMPTDESSDVSDAHYFFIVVSLTDGPTVDKDEQLEHPFCSPRQLDQGVKNAKW
ncbi:hypothetical protein SCHPADRAFT_952540, partial [Schizopora paradoxa]